MKSTRLLRAQLRAQLRVPAEGWKHPNHETVVGIPYAVGTRGNQADEEMSH